MKSSVHRCGRIKLQLYFGKDLVVQEVFEESTMKLCTSAFERDHMVESAERSRFS